MEGRPQDGEWIHSQLRRQLGEREGGRVELETLEERIRLGLQNAANSCDRTGQQGREEVSNSR
eukprot:1374685-Alexandrium_andersonii.AAC.1